MRYVCLTALQDLDNTERRKSCLKHVDLCPRNCGAALDENCCEYANLDSETFPVWDQMDQFNKWLPWAGANAYCGALRTGAHLVRSVPSQLWACGTVTVVTWMRLDVGRIGHNWHLQYLLYCKCCRLQSRALAHMSKVQETCFQRYFEYPLRFSYALVPVCYLTKSCFGTGTAGD